jgi:hypothetical protein
MTAMDPNLSSSAPPRVWARTSKWINKIWHDPVWSKVIATVIIVVGSAGVLWLMSVLGKLSPRGMVATGVCGAFIFTVFSLVGYVWQNFHPARAA